MHDSFLGKKILVVTAHPDDESFIAAGTIYQNNQQGGSTRVLCATHGGKGRAHLDREHTELELKQRRKQELGAVVQVLGIEEYEVLDYPDGALEDFIFDVGHEVSRVVEQWKPDILLTFGMDGFTGHKDHVAVHAATLIVAEHFSLPVLMATIPPAPWKLSFQSALFSKRKCEVYTDDTLNIESPILDVYITGTVKLQALQCYASQWRGLDPYTIFTPELAEHFLSHEYFILKQST